MTNITEIAPDTYRISTYIPEFGLGFSQFLVQDDEPLLFHTGPKAMFPIVHESVSKILDPAAVRWIGFSHFEADECGSLNEWHEAAPHATGVCSMVGKLVSVDDFAPKNPAKGMVDGEKFSTGSHTFRFLHTPHVPHNWEAGLLFDTATGVLFSSDILHQNGDVEPLTSNSVTDRARQTFAGYAGRAACRLSSLCRRNRWHVETDRRSKTNNGRDNARFGFQRGR